MVIFPVLVLVVEEDPIMAVKVAWLVQEHSSEFFPSVTDLTEDLVNISSSVVQVDALWEICIVIECHLYFDKILEQDHLMQ